jgi:hypothetical protein
MLQCVVGKVAPPACKVPGTSFTETIIITSASHVENPPWRLIDYFNDVREVELEPLYLILKLAGRGP